MKKILLLILLFNAITARADDEFLDTLSYAVGCSMMHHIAQSGELSFEFTEANSMEAIRGIEDMMPLMGYAQDSTSGTSFVLGCFQGIFFSDGYEHNKDKISLDCIALGLMRVINGQLTLPQDTIAINRFMNSLPEGTNPAELPDETRNQFYTYYGIMKGLQPGLQEYICEQTGKTKDECPANQKAYAAGFLTVVNSLNNDETPNAFGKNLALEVITQPSFYPLEVESFVDGCRGALGLSERKLTIEEADAISTARFQTDNDIPVITQEKTPN